MPEKNCRAYLIGMTGSAEPHTRSVGAAMPPSRPPRCELFSPSSDDMNAIFAFGSFMRSMNESTISALASVDADISANASRALSRPG